MSRSIVECPPPQSPEPPPRVLNPRVSLTEHILQRPIPRVSCTVKELECPRAQPESILQAPRVSRGAVRSPLQEFYLAYSCIITKGHVPTQPKRDAKPSNKSTTTKIIAATLLLPNGPARAGTCQKTLNINMAGICRHLHLHPFRNSATQVSSCVGRA